MVIVMAFGGGFVEKSSGKERKSEIGQRKARPFPGPKSQIQKPPTKHKIRTMMPYIFVKGLNGRAPCRAPTGFSEP